MLLITTLHSSHTVSSLLLAHLHPVIVCTLTSSLTIWPSCFSKKPVIWQRPPLLPNQNFSPAIGNFDAFKHELTGSAQLITSAKSFGEWSFSFYLKAWKLVFGPWHYKLFSWESRHCIFTSGFCFPGSPLCQPCINFILPSACLSDVEKHTLHYIILIYIMLHFIAVSNYSVFLLLMPIQYTSHRTMNSTINCRHIFRSLIYCFFPVTRYPVHQIYFMFIPEFTKLSTLSYFSYAVCRGCQLGVLAVDERWRNRDIIWPG